MNIVTANKLYELRRKANLSQEELADKIGVSRQAVSKWERAESSPDTDNLIALAQIYGVTLDELLNVDQVDIEEVLGKEEDSKIDLSKESTISIEKDDKKVKIIIPKYDDDVELHVDCCDDDDEQSPLMRILVSTTFLSSIIAMFLIGALVKGGWSWSWTLILFAASLVSLFKAIAKKNPAVFAFPVLIAGLYCLFGILFGWWHPGWVMFLLIPIFYSIVGPLKKIKREKNNK